MRGDLRPLRLRLPFTGFLPLLLRSLRSLSWPNQETPASSPTPTCLMAPGIFSCSHHIFFGLKLFLSACFSHGRCPSWVIHATVLGLLESRFATRGFTGRHEARPLPVVGFGFGLRVDAGLRVG